MILLNMCLRISINLGLKILCCQYLTCCLSLLSSAEAITFLSLRRSLGWTSGLRKAIARFCVVCRVEQSYQKVMALWHQLHVNTKSLISWNYLRKDLDLVKTWNLEKVIMEALTQAYSLLASFIFSAGLLLTQLVGNEVRDTVAGLGA